MGPFPFWFSAGPVGRMHPSQRCRLPTCETLCARLQSCSGASSTWISLRSKLFAAAWRFFESRNRPIPRLLWLPVEANDIIRRDYRPRTYGGSAVLFQAAPNAWTHPDAHAGWRELIKGGLEVRSIPGRHYEIMKAPHVRTLARELADCLSKVQHRRASEASLVVQPENRIPLKTS